MHQQWENSPATASSMAGSKIGKYSLHSLQRSGNKHDDIRSAETIPKQQAHVMHWRSSLSQMPEFFKRVYKTTFLLARQPGQKVLPLDTAIEYWRLLFTAPGLSWTSSSTPWLDRWIEYLEGNWKKSISKDMWDQTLSFVLKSRDDESMSWWSEDGAWPGVLDEFVMHVRQKKGGAETEMDIG